MQFSIDLSLIFDRFWEGFGGQDDPQIEQKSIENRCQKTDKKMCLKKSREVMQGYVTLRRPGVGGPYNQSIPFNPGASSGHSFPIVPQRQGGG